MIGPEHLADNEGLIQDMKEFKESHAWSIRVLAMHNNLDPDIAVARWNEEWDRLILFCDARELIKSKLKAGEA
jgi:hypothetical protein